MILKEKYGNVWDYPTNQVLVFSFSKDLIPDGFSEQVFSMYPHLLNIEDPTLGGIATLNNGDRDFVALITKESSLEDAEYETIEMSLEALLDYCKENRIRKIVSPTIGAGTNTLDWKYIRKIINTVFKDTDVEWTIVHKSKI